MPVRIPARSSTVLAAVVLLAVRLLPTPAQAAPPIQTTIVSVPGLAQPAEILVDGWGIPHIYAANETDAYLAQGFDAARLRLWQIDFWRRRGLGLLASTFGPHFLGYDRAARLFLDRTDPKVAWANYDPSVARDAAAFTAGVNAYITLIDRNPELLPPEFVELGYRPERWRPEDLLRIGEPPSGLDSRVARAELACKGGLRFDSLRQKLTPPWKIEVPVGLDPCAINFDDLDTLFRADAHIVVTPAMLKAGLLPRTQLGDLTGADEAREGSNIWAIATSKSATGRPILAHDPHTPFEVPSLRLIVQVTAPGLHFIGAGYPEEPGISRGHNDRIAWGSTDFAANLGELYVYETKPGDPDMYRYRDGWERMTTIREAVPVRGAAPVVMTFKDTRHGPVVSEDQVHHRAIAVGLVPATPGAAPALFNLMAGIYRAQDWPGFLAAARHDDTGNYVYAGVDGTIGWMAAARVPIRPNFDGLMPVPGDGRYEHKGTLPNDDLLTETNPARGWIASANQFNLPPDYPVAARKVGFEWEPDYRYVRIAEILSQPRKLTLQDNVALQNDVLSLPAEALVPLLDAVHTDNADFLTARGMLSAWDRRLTGDSGAAALFEIWEYRHLRPLLLARVVPPALLPVMGEGDIRSVIALLQHPDERLGPDPVAARDAVLLESLVAATAETRSLLGDHPETWHWSDLHRAVFRHPFSQVLSPALRALADADFGGKGGDTYTVMATWVPGTGTMNMSGGASFSMVLNVGDWDNSVVLATQGESGIPTEAHYRDLYPRWLAGASFPLLYSRALVEKVAESRWELEPAP
jgi:penicillin amidase